MQLALTPIDSAKCGLYYLATFGLTIDPIFERQEIFANSPHDSRRAWRTTDAIKEKFLNQRLLRARVKMPCKHARSEQGNALHAQRDEKPTAEARA